MSNLIKNPTWPMEKDLEEFRLKMVALGARWNNTYNGWNVPTEKLDEAKAIRAQYPDREYVPPVNGATLRFG